MLVLGRVKNPRSSSKSQGAVGETEILDVLDFFHWVNIFEPDYFSLWFNWCFGARWFGIRGIPRFESQSLSFSGILLLMAEILHQLRLVVFPIIYRVSYIPGGARFQPSTVGIQTTNHLTIS